VTALFRSVNPADGEEVARYPAMTWRETDAVLARAAGAFSSWSVVSAHERAERLARLANRLRGSAAGLAHLIVTETGKPIRQAEAEIAKSAAAVDWYVANGPAILAPEAVPTGAALSEVRFRPLGPVLAVMPWNYPVWQILRAAFPILLAGNSVVLKHAPNVTGCALAFAELLADEEPLLQVALTDDEVTGRMIADRRIAGVTLTGSVRAGRAVGALAGQHLKTAVLELGGSDPFVVLSDADVGRAAEAACWARMQNNGQACIAAKRLIVTEPVADAFLSELSQRVRSLVVAEPADRATDIGPLARSDVRDTLERQLESSVSRGAQVVEGGGVPARSGWWFEPTVLVDARPGMPAWDDETFGPLAAVQVVRDDEAALAAARHPQYGLGTSLWTADEERGAALADRLETGMVFVNGVVGSDPRLPFGGIRDSGVGRELGPYGLREFTNITTVVVGAP
jgi:acyl-CoA reductase-like NAD-dependent aldehyde dehydrogenase